MSETRYSPGKPLRNPVITMKKERGTKSFCSFQYVALLTFFTFMQFAQTRDSGRGFTPKVAHQPFALPSFVGGGQPYLQWHGPAYAAQKPRSA